MNRKTFLTQLGGVGLVAMLPVNLLMAKSKSDPLKDKRLKGKVVLTEEGKVLKIFGNKQVHKFVGKDNNNQLVEWVDYLAPGSGIPPHIHTKEDEVFRIIEGQVEIMVGNKTTVLNAGDMAFAPKNVVHSWKVVGTKKAQMCVSAFPSGMEFMFDELNDLPPGKPDTKKVSEISAKYGIRFV